MQFEHQSEIVLFLCFLEKQVLHQPTIMFTDDEGFRMLSSVFLFFANINIHICYYTISRNICFEYF